jgi:hypothetical protein
MMNGNYTMKKAVPIIVLLLVALLLSSCLAGPNDFLDTPSEKGKVAGFLRGLWHGFIALFTFIISLFTDKVNVYEVHNSGGWYDFGFIVGIMVFFGGGAKGTCRRSR